MEAPAQRIRNAVASVSGLRQAASATPALGRATGQVKRLQSARFAGTYADLLANGPYRAATRFFLDELYSDKDYAERDGQFARIAGTIERLFPARVVETAVGLAQLHALTESLDHALAVEWLAQEGVGLDDADRYTLAWRRVGRRADREAQLANVLAIGRQMVRLTGTPGLRTMLRMMRGPATAAGMGSLQRFLETGFDTFAAMARQPRNAEGFLETVEQRETALLAMLFDEELVACGTELRCILGQAR